MKKKQHTCQNTTSEGLHGQHQLTNGGYSARLTMKKVSSRGQSNVETAAMRLCFREQHLPALQVTDALHQRQAHALALAPGLGATLERYPADLPEAQLLARILTERRARWEAKQLAKFAEQGKTPPKDWQKKYPEPVQPDTTGLPALPQGWVWASVDQLAESVRNGLSKTPNTEGKGFPIFKINAVRPMAVNFSAIKHIELSEADAADYWVEVGDVLATRYNGSVDLLGVFGLVKKFSQQTLYPDKLIRMKPVLGGVAGSWLEMCGNVGFSRAHLVSRVKTTAGQTGISGNDLKKTPIPLPPVDEQTEILECVGAGLEHMAYLELPIEHSLRQSAAQRQNILRAAFAGQLVPQDPADEPASVLLERIRAERAAQNAAKPARGRKPKVQPNA